VCICIIFGQPCATLGQGAVWTGIGAVGTAAMGVLFMGDSSSPARLACMAAIVGGVAGLKLVSN